jgi:diacylglycerol kinase (ATP)
MDHCLMVATLLGVNTQSRCGSESTDAIRARLETLGPVVSLNLCAKGALEKALDEHRPTLQRIVIGGGDGTVNHWLPTLVDSGLPCGLLPMGTANDLARSLELPLEPLDSVEAILDGHTRTVKLACVNDRLFVNAVGIGLGPELTKSLDHERKRRLGVLAYFWSLIDTLLHIPNRRATLTVDGTTHKVAFMQITVANGIHYGGGMTIDEDAELDDGWLRILRIKPQSPLKLLGQAARLRRGTHSSRQSDEKIIVTRARKVIIQTTRRTEFTADGELIGKTPVECRASSKAIEFYAPHVLPESSQAPDPGTIS